MTEGIETSLTFLAKHCCRWSGYIKSTNAQLTSKTATVMVGRHNLSTAKVKQICASHPSRCHAVREGRRVHKSLLRLLQRTSLTLRHHLAETDALLDIYESIMTRAPSTDFACRPLLFVLVLT